MISFVSGTCHFTLVCVFRRICQEVFFTPDQTLVEEGSAGDSMFVIVQGEVMVTRDGVEVGQTRRPRALR